MRTPAVRMSGLVCVVLFLLSAGRALAQGAPGTIRGQVTDPSGAVVANVSVMATPAPGQPGQPKAATVAKDGTYKITGLAPGTYSVSAVAQGFGPFLQSVQVAAGVSKRLDIQAPDSGGTAGGQRIRGSADAQRGAGGQRQCRGD